MSKIEDKAVIGSPYKHQHSTTPNTKQLNVKNIFLVSAIIDEGKTVPLFIVEDPTFGIRHFNNWKIDHGFAENLAKVEVLPFITEIDITEQDFNLIKQKLKEKFKKGVKNES